MLYVFMIDLEIKRPRKDEDEETNAMVAGHQPLHKKTSFLQGFELYLVVKIPSSLCIMLPSPLKLQ